MYSLYIADIRFVVKLSASVASAFYSVMAAADFLPLRSLFACSRLDNFLSFTSSCTQHNHH